MAAIKNKSQRDFRIVSSASKNDTSLDFNQIRVGKKKLTGDVVLSQFYQQKTRKKKYTKEQVLQALDREDLKKLREISEYFFNTNGIYSRLCRYMAYLYRYDHFVTPIVYDEKIKDTKVIEGWFKSTQLLENCNLKRTFGEIALKVIKRGMYYGYIIKQKTAIYLQELPVDYCRSRFKVNGQPAIEFNIKYFDDMFTDTAYRTRILKMFPKEFQKAYVSYKKGTLAADFRGDEKGWFLLDPTLTVKFNLSNTDAPLFVGIVPSLMDLDEAQDLDRQKMEQQLIKVIVQKFPIDKNGDLIFDMDEMAELHKNAVYMLGDAIGLDVLSTVADVDSIDLSDNSKTTTTDQLEKVERTVYNEAGVSQMQFNTEGNIALEKSIANDAATMTDLLLQFESFCQRIIAGFNKNPKRLFYKVQMLPTTIYNYQDLSKLYEEQTQIGFSKLLPQVALGQDQSTVIATAYFENKLMNLQDLFIPPQMSSTMSASGSDRQAESDGGQSNRKSDDQKSDKTIRNIESGS